MGWVWLMFDAQKREGIYSKQRLEELWKTRTGEKNGWKRLNEINYVFYKLSNTIQARSLSRSTTTQCCLNTDFKLVQSSSFTTPFPSSSPCPLLFLSSLRHWSLRPPSSFFSPTFYSGCLNGPSLLAACGPSLRAPYSYSSQTSPCTPSSLSFTHPPLHSFIFCLSIVHPGTRQHSV